MSAVRKASGLLTIRRISVRDAGGLKHIGAARARVADGLKLVYSALSVALSTYFMRGYGNSTSTVTVTTPQNVTASALGGAAPFTYAWARTDGGGHPWTITSPTAAETAFRTDLDPGALESATFQCAVTDASGASVSSAEVTITAVNLGGGL